MLNIYKASAGSGKTYRLAYEYIRALLGVKAPGTDTYRLNHPKYLNGSAAIKNQHRHILAITFTNKATEEMKRRIIDELDALASCNLPIHGAGDPKQSTTDSAYAADLCKEMGCTRSELAEVADAAMRQILYDYDSFAVTTIDSFFQRVLRTFARELDRQGDFAIELNDFAVVQAAVDNMLDEFNVDIKKNPSLGQWIYRFLKQQMDEGKKTNFFNRKSALHTSLVRYVARINKETFKPYLQQTKALVSNPENMIELKKQVLESRKLVLEPMKLLTTKLFSDLETHGVTYAQMNKKPGLIKSLPSIEQGDVPKWDYLSGETFDKLMDGRSPIFNAKNCATEEDYELVREYFRKIKVICANAQVIESLAGPIDNLMLLGYAWRYLDNYVTENNLVLISETNHLLSRIIGNDDTPFIYERMGVNYRHFLIDEFQDTSKMQWGNLYPLVGTGLSEGHDSLIIGDEKQSIYRFRNSDSSLLHTQVADVDFADDIYNVEIHGARKGENTNWRSAADVVRFNNTLFTLLANSEGHMIEGFENVVQDIAPKHLDEPGYIRLIPIVDEPEEEDTDTDGDSQRTDDEGVEDTDLSVKSIDLMYDNIQRQHREGKYRWSDIVVLVRKNKEGASVIERIAQLNSQRAEEDRIPIVSDESLYLQRSKAVQLIVNTLEIIANETGNPDKTPMTQKKYKSYREVMLIISRFAHYLKQNADANKSLRYAMEEEQPDPSQVISDYIDAIKDRKASSLTSLVETIAAQVLTDEERHSQMAYITAFHDYVTDYCNYNNQSIRALLNHWNTAKKDLTVTSSADIDAVRVMTVHKSKGLEYDCVHIPFGSWGDESQHADQWVPFPDIEGVDPAIKPPMVYIDLKNNINTIPGTYFYDQYTKYRADALVDMMNTTYVAYTRAARELMIYYQPSEGIGAMISTVLTDAQEGSPADSRLCDLKSAYDQASGALTLGAPTVRKEEKDKGKPDDILVVNDYDVYFHDGAKVLTSVDDMLEVNHDIAADDAAPKADTYEIDDEEARQRGIVMHDILSLISTIDDIEYAVEQVSYVYRLSSKDQTDAKMFIEQMLDAGRPEIDRWFVDNTAALNEQSIYLPEGDAHRHTDDASDVPDDYRRPDRIVFCNDGSVDVVDYKFTSQVRKGHKLQVSGYVEILKSMGYDRVRGYLWYPFQDKIVAVASDN